MTTEENKFTVGKTTFYQGEDQSHPLFRIEPGFLARAPANKPLNSWAMPAT